MGQQLSVYPPDFNDYVNYRQFEQQVTENRLAGYSKSALKIIAISKGLERHGGFNGRSISCMRKRDFIDFILLQNYRLSLRQQAETSPQSQPVPTDDPMWHLNLKPSTEPIKPTIIEDEEVDEETRVIECKICTINKVCMVLPGCGHVFCYSCVQRFENKCATCRTQFAPNTAIRMYL